MKKIILSAIWMLLAINCMAQESSGMPQETIPPKTLLVETKAEADTKIQDKSLAPAIGDSTAEQQKKSYSRKKTNSETQRKKLAEKSITARHIPTKTEVLKSGIPAFEAAKTATPTAAETATAAITSTPTSTTTATAAIDSTSTSATTEPAAIDSTSTSDTTEPAAIALTSEAKHADTAPDAEQEHAIRCTEEPQAEIEPMKSPASAQDIFTEINQTESAAIQVNSPINITNGRFLPMRRRIDRGINQGRFVYKGELIVGLTASYGTMSSEETDFLVILNNIDLKGTIATVKPFIGYFYRDNRCLGVRFGYQHMSGKLGNLDLDLGEQNDITMNIGGMELASDSYSFGLFHRSYVGLDAKGRFGLFAEVEASMMTGTSDFINGSGDAVKATYSDNFKAKLAFNPGLAVYIFPNVCTTVSIGLGGIQYSSVTQRDADGNKTGSRKTSKMQFRINIADINFGVVVHLWDKKRK